MSGSVAGLASGMNWQETIDLLMQVKQQPVVRLIEQQDKYREKLGAWNVLQTLLEQLESKSIAVDTKEEVLAKNATSSNTDKLSVSASAEAQPTSHTVEINQLAQNQVVVHSGWPDSNTTSVTQSGNVFEYTYDGQTVTLTLDNGTTVQGLVNAINDDENNPGVTASLIDDGGTTDPIHLVIAGDDPKASNTFTVNDANTTIGTTGNEFDDASFTTTQDAQEAEIRVDGFPTAGWITRSTNEIDDVIPGVTLYLKEPTAVGSPVVVDVTNDYAETKQKIKDWVNAYNEVVRDINSKTRYDPETETRGILMDDAQVRQVRSTLVQMVSNEIPGIDPSEAFSTLGSIGINLGSESTLVVNDAELQEALEADPEAVARLFTFSTQTSTDTFEFFYRSEQTQGGRYAIEADYKADGTLNAAGTQLIKKLDRYDNVVATYEATVKDNYYLIGPEGSPVEGLRIKFNNPGGGPGTATGQLDLITGVGTMGDKKVDVMTNWDTGLVPLVKDGYNTQIESIDDQLLIWERRLERERERLQKQFLAMEQAVQEAQNQASWIGGM